MPPKTLYNLFIRWSRLGVFDPIFIDSTHLKAHPTAASPFKEVVLSRCISCKKGGLNSRLHVVCDEGGKPLVMLLTEGQMSNHKGAWMMLDALPPASASIWTHGPCGRLLTRLLAIIAEAGVSIPDSRRGESKRSARRSSP